MVLSVIRATLKCEQPGAIRVSCDGWSTDIPVEPDEELREYETIYLCAGDEYHICMESTEGEVQLAEVRFEEEPAAE